MNFQNIPEELQVKIFGYCELKPLLEVCSGIHKIILTNKCLNRKLFLDCEKILKRISENCEDESFYQMLANREFKALLISTPTNPITNEIIERCRKFIIRLITNVRLDNLEKARNCIENIKKFEENLEELEFYVTSDYRFDGIQPFLLSNQNIPKFRKLVKLKICSSYANWCTAYGEHQMTTDLDIHRIFENVNSLRELTLVSNIEMDGRLILNQPNLKRLEILSKKKETIHVFKDLEVDEIRNNVKFQLDELAIENPRLFVIREKLLAFVLTQKQLKKFILRQFYDDFYCYEVIPRILRHVLELKTLQYLEVECDRNLIDFLKKNLNFENVKICKFKEI